MRNDKVRIVVRAPQTITEHKNLFERNQGFIQFILVLASIAALCVTIYFSFKSIQISSNQLEQGQQQIDQAKKQLELAESQFKASEKQRKIDNVEKVAKELTENGRFKIQNDINEKNLEAIELQAKIAKKQYEAQIIAAKDQVYQNRPIFGLISAKYDSIHKWANFEVQNTGKRPAKIISSRFISYNETSKQLNSNFVPLDNLEANETFRSSFVLIMSKSDFLDSKTLYYIDFVFEDIAIGKNEHFVKYFEIRTIGKEKSWAELNENERKILSTKAKSKNLNLEL